MDEVIKDIINIDKATLRMKQQYEKIIKEKENEIRIILADLEKNYIEEDILQENSSNQDDIMAELAYLEDVYRKNMDNLDKTYKNIKYKIIENIWNDLFLGKEGI